MWLDRGCDWIMDVAGSWITDVVGSWIWLDHECGWIRDLAGSWMWLDHGCGWIMDRTRTNNVIVKRAFFLMSESFIPILCFR